MIGLGAEFLLGMLSLGLVIQLGAGSPPRLPADVTPQEDSVPFASVSPSVQGRKPRGCYTVSCPHQALEI